MPEDFRKTLCATVDKLRANMAAADASTWWWLTRSVWPLNANSVSRNASSRYAYGTLRRLDLNRNAIRGLRCAVAPKHCVDAYEAVALPLHQRCRELDRQAQNSTDVRDALLPRLISGQRRLPDAQALAA